MSDDWVRTRRMLDGLETLDLYSSGLGEKLLPWLRSGQLKARAASVVHRDGDHERTAADMELPPAIWASAVVDGFFLGDDRLTIYNGSSLPRLEAAGLAFDRAGLLRVFDLDDIEGAAFDPKAPRLASPAHQPNDRGRGLDTQRWANFAAALATLASKGDVDGTMKQASIYGAVADFLVKERGRDDPLGIDAAAPLLRLFKSWSQGRSAPGDHDYSAPD